MKFLFTLHPMLGHFHAMVPLAQSLQKRGHEVAFATGENLKSNIVLAGFRYFPCGLNVDGSIESLESTAGWKALEKRFPVGAILQLAGLAEIMAPKMGRDLIDLMDSWLPNVIIRDPVEFGGYLAAESRSLPHATINWSFYVPAKYMIGRSLANLRAQFGLPIDPDLDTLDKYLLLDFMPERWVQKNWPSPEVTHRFCSKPFDHIEQKNQAQFIVKNSQEPTVYATLGTTYNQTPATFQAIIDAVRDVECRLILTVGNSVDPDQFKNIGKNIEVYRYFPQSKILPHCSVVIHHGGYNSLYGALWHGLPAVLIPQGGADQYPVALRCLELGLGLVADGVPPAASAIKRALKHIFSDDRYRTSAQNFRDEIMGLSSMDEAVLRLEMLSKNREPQVQSSHLVDELPNL